MKQFTGNTLTFKSYNAEEDKDYRLNFNDVIEDAPIEAINTLNEKLSQVIADPISQVTETLRYDII